MPVDVYGVRHHGPGSARAVRAALEEQPPDLVLIEGCPELDAIVDLLRRGRHGAARRRAGVRRRRAAAGDVLPARPLLAGVGRGALGARARRAGPVPRPPGDPRLRARRRRRPPRPSRTGGRDATDAGRPDPTRRRRSRPSRLDPIGTLAATAGLRRRRALVGGRRRAAARRRRPSASPRSARRWPRSGPPTRRPDDDPDVRSNARREQWMRRVLRAEIKAAPEARIAVVCGAWHAPALVPADFPPATRDADLITKLPRTKVAAAWTPWTAARLSYASGYGAGVSAPGWYQHLFDHLSRHDPDPRDLATSLAGPGRPHPARGTARRLDRVGGRGRPPRRDPGHRPRSSVRRAERARRRRARPCCARGPGCRSTWSTGASWWARSSGRVPESAPVVPLAADLARQQRSLRLKPTASVPAGRPRPAAREPARPVGPPAPPPAPRRRRGARPPTPAAPPARSRRAGRWSGGPSCAVDLVEAGVWGTTIAAAAAARAADRPRGPPTSPSWPPWSAPASPPTCPTASRRCSTPSTRAPRSSTTYPPCWPRSSRSPAPAATATCAVSTPHGCAPCSAPRSSAPASACRWRARASTRTRPPRW